MTPWLLLCSLRSGFHQNLSPREVYFKRATKNPCTSSRRWLGQNDIRIQASERNFFIIWSVLHERWRCSFLPRKSWALQCPVQLYVIMFSAALHHHLQSSALQTHTEIASTPSLLATNFREDFTIHDDSKWAESLLRRSRKSGVLRALQKRFCPFRIIVNRGEVP